MKLTDKNGTEYDFIEGNQFTARAFGELIKSKPKPKKIDMSVCIESGIDMEFSDCDDFVKSETIDIGKLASIINDKFRPYKSDCDAIYPYCRPRMNHIHACPDGFDKCPVPEGFVVNVNYRQPSLLVDAEHLLGNGLEASRYTWNHAGGLTDIIAFEVTGIAEGYTL